MGAQGLRHWTSREVPLDISFEESHGQTAAQGRLRDLRIFLLEDLIWKGMRRYQSELSWSGATMGEGSIMDFSSKLGPR